MVKWIFIEMVLLLSVLANSQPIDGQVVDVWGAPVSQAHVNCGGKVSITNENGHFSLACNKDRTYKIIISAVGYKEKRLSINALDKTSNLLVVIEDSVYALARVEVLAESPLRILSEAINTSLKGLQQIEAEAFYRQTHNENGIYVRLIEADVTIQHDKNYRTADKIKIHKLRRSLVYERNSDTHGDHIADLLEENIFYSPGGSIMDVSVLKQFELAYGTDSIRPDLTVIKYAYQSGQDPKIRTGKVFIDTLGYIIELTEHTQPNPLYWPQGNFGSAGDTRWDFREGEKRIIFVRKDMHLIPVSITQTYLHHISDRYSGLVRYHLVESFELWYNDINSGNTTCEGLKVHGGLYSLKYQYDSAFWSQYQPVKQYPLSKEVIFDLESSKPLQQQFEEAGR